MKMKIDTKDQEALNKEKNKKYFKNWNKQKEETLTKIGIEEIQLFGKTEDLNNTLEENITIIILPINDYVDEEGKETKQKLEEKGIKTTKEDKPIDIQTPNNEQKEEKTTITYLKNKNIILTKTNPLNNEKIWELMIQELKEITIKKINKEEAEENRIIEQWNNQIERNKQQKINDIRNSEETLKNLEEQYKQTLQNKEELNKQIETIESMAKDKKQHLKNEIQKIKELPIKKTIRIEEGKIKIRFGEIKLTGQVRTGKEIKEGTERPRMETKQVYIGEIEFQISEDKITIHNTNNELEGGIQHPHATNNKPCYGNEGLKVTSLKAGFQIEKLVKFLYSWVYSYNKDDGPARTYLQQFYDKQIKKEKADKKE